MPPPQPLRLIRKLPRPINTRAPRPVAIDEIPSLDHEVPDHAVEPAALVALRAAQVVLGLAGAELTEVLSCTWHYIFEQFHLDAAERLACAASVSACLFNTK